MSISPASSGTPSSLSSANSDPMGRGLAMSGTPGLAGFVSAFGRDQLTQLLFEDFIEQHHGDMSKAMEYLHNSESTDFVLIVMAQ